MRRAVAAAVGVVAVLAVLGYFLHNARSRPEPGPVPADPAALVGAWWADRTGVLDDRLLVLLPTGEAQVYGEGDCTFFGGWSATDAGLASISLNGAGGSCRKEMDSAYDVSGSISRFWASGDDVRLSNSAGTVAFLRPALRGDWPDSARSEVGLVEALAEPYAGRSGAPALPAGVAVPTTEQLVGVRWLPVETVGSTRWPDRTRPHAEFDAGGRWSGADGCNGQGGTWSVDAESGQWLASNNGQTEIFCNNVDVASIVAQARAAGLDGEELVLFDADGAELGRFVQE
jgi:META domain